MRASPRDTIAAISTALGPGAIAIVRLSGERAVHVADAVFRGATLAPAARPKDPPRLDASFFMVI